MEIKEEKRGEVKIIGLPGKLDAETSPDVQKRLMNIMDQGERRLVFDFSELTYISSAGLRVLIEVARNLHKTNGKLALAALSDHVYAVIKIAGFTSIFSIFPTCEEAVAYAQSDSRGEGSSTVLPIAA
jgi:anti-sigma B factor antagonist